MRRPKKSKKAIDTHNSFAVVGGGFIGLEIASSIAQLGKVAHVIEMGNHLMGRVIPKQISTLVLIIMKKKVMLFI